MAQSASSSFIRLQLDSHSVTSGDQLSGSIQLHITIPVPSSVLLLKLTGKEIYTYMESRRERDWSGNIVTRKYPKHDKSPLTKQVFTAAVFPSQMIPPGQYSYPFIIRTAPNMIPSLVLDRGETKAEIRYRLVAKGNRDTFVQKAIAALTVTRDINPLEGVKELQALPARLKSMCCVDRGTASVSATLDKDAYFPGDTMVVSLKVDNKDSGLNVVACSAAIYREFIVRDYHTGNRNVVQERVNSSSVPADIPAGKSLLSVQTVQIPIRVVESSGRAFTAPSVSGKLVSCGYRVEAQAEMGGWFMCCGQRPKAILAFSVFRKPFQEKPQELIKNWDPVLFPLVSFEAGAQYHR